MDYEKAYKEAIKRAKAMIEVAEKEEVYKSAITIFPELKESEDEKIRKEIIETFKILGDGKIPVDINYTDIFTWLEKQNHDGKKWIYEDVYLKEKEQLIQDGIDEVLENPQKYGLEKQDKEEYALKSFKDEDVRKFMQYIEKEAKAYEFNLPNRGYDIYAFAKDILAWLEKQGENKHLELKAGHWYICYRAYCCRADHLTVKEGEKFKCEKDGIVKGFVIKDPENYFKEISITSPIEEGTWNPSDEQIKAIRLARSFVVDDFGEHPTLSEILMELEEQLLQKIKKNKS